MSVWAVTNLAVLGGAATVAWFAWRHLLRSPPQAGRRREATALCVVTTMALGGFAVAHVQLGQQWGSGIAVTDWWWLVYAAGFSAALWIAHLALRRLPLPVDELVLPVVGVALLFGLLNVWVWETRDANAYVSSVALPEMRDLERRLEEDPRIDAADASAVRDALGVVPNELTYLDEGQGPPHVLNPAWVDRFNAARDRYVVATDGAPASLGARTLPPVVTDNLLRRQLGAAVLAVLALPAVVALICALARRRSIRRAVLTAGAVLLAGLAVVGVGQGTSGRLPAFVQIGGVTVTVFSLSALAAVVVLPLTITARQRRSRYWWAGAAALAVSVASLLTVDTGAGIILGLLIAAGITAHLVQPWRGVAHTVAIGALLAATAAVIVAGNEVLPDRATGRLDAWVAPWTTHDDAETDNAAARAVEAIAELGDTPGAASLTPSGAAAIIDRELTWRLDTVDGQPVVATPFVPRDAAGELVLRQAELLWSDLGGYRVERGSTDADALTARIQRAIDLVWRAGDTATSSGGDLSAMSIAARADTLQVQRALYGLDAGGLIGVGLARGRPEAVPEITEDMAIVYVGEALGLVGIALVVGLILLLASRGIRRAAGLGGASGGIVAGISVLLGLQVLVNLGGATGAIPLTGIAFPLISRSGTGALVTAVGLAATMALVAGAVGRPTDAPVPAPAPTLRLPRLRLDPMVVTAVVLVANLAAIQLLGRQLVPGPIGASIPPVESGLLIASDAWDLPDVRTVAGAIRDRHGTVLAETTALGQRSYPDPELAASLSHTLAQLERTLPVVDGSTGPDLITTIDAEVQRSVHQAIDAAAAESDLVDPDDLRGAVVVVDLTTGELIALESRPSFSMVELTDGEAWARAEGEERRAGFPYRHLNRIVDGAYPPGSVAKIITAAAALEHGLHVIGQDDFDFRSGPLGPRPPDDVKHFGIWHEVRFADGGVISDGHLGQLDDWRFDIERAFAHSSNVAFALMAVELGPDRLADTARSFGYERADEIDYYGAFSATLAGGDHSVADVLETGPTAVAQAGMGQGESLTSPLQLALIPAAIGNGGAAMAPYLVAELAHADGRIETVGSPRQLFETGLSDTTIDDLRTLMAATVDYGTGRAATSPGTPPELRPAGKTGSAQWSAELDRTHALFAGYHPRSDPRLAFAVIIERGGAGGGIGADIVRRILESPAVDAYLETATPTGSG